ncbi:DUF3168 domain-containing protein [Massilia sp. UMI-21]|nr:DUF3168 domain-containing protein [Massilia sp. UMI-21]
MSAVKAVIALLKADDRVAALFGDRVSAGDVPQGAALPAIGVREISSVPVGAIDAQAANSLVTSRVQVTAHVKTYPELAGALRAARQACNFERGLIADVDVASVVRDIIGPDLQYESGHAKSIDFTVTHHEPN